jgi:branched-chain amino acid aminotransferase
VADAGRRVGPHVWLDGELLPLGDAGVSVLDRGLLLGEGCFETLKAIDGVPFALRRHLERLRVGARVLGIELPWSDDELRSAVHDVLHSDPVGATPLTRLRITLTGGPAPLGPGTPAEPSPSVLVTCGPLAAPADAAVASTSRWPVNERSPLAGVKHTSRAELVLALAAAHAEGADEALLANTAGHLVEGTGSNVFVAVDGRLLTPSLASGCLPGVTRSLVLELTGAEEAELEMSVLATADEVFLTSSTRDVQPVAQVDGRRLPAPGPVTEKAMAAFADLTASTSDP